ncbi:putative DegT/DnrJ/EryC1/StrS aminotransferase protein family [Lunatimonas lonarensis]|uniref:Putative DegT/DnrJ/EryC1/StrS aminotransferase protein family n=1 Tax=Lunatimonas lonarensis TaxID=1232681 RepID=R7ZX45_9BACT|nr:DegT/DnrJ/EryC1/StrS family aminotransferase [Lunatimonas lonarensis]EON78578.1 putative DegT/DnrJ/EryC1/StrS aminotransferase protein family [Lunatimonas lonarensis]
MSMRIPFLDLDKVHQSLQKELSSKFQELVRTSVFSGGKEVDAFAEEIRNYLGEPFVIPCSNGTDALEIAMKVLGIGYGDEVILPALTWVSTAEAIRNVGAVPRFVDVTAEGLIDLDSIEQKVSSATKAIVPVHLYGKMVGMDRLSRIAERSGLKVIEDAAQAFGAFSNGRSAGLWGTIGCFSFYPTKNLGALGEAGMLVTMDAEWAKQCRLWVNHGQVARNEHLISGRNAKIDTLQAAFLRIKLRHFSGMQGLRKELAEIYLRRLRGIDELILPTGILGHDHNAHLFTVQCRQRNQLKSYLEKHGIGSAIHYPQILPHMSPFLDGVPYPVAETVAKTTLSLPLNTGLTQEEVQEVAEVVARFFE